MNLREPCPQRLQRLVLLCRFLECVLVCDGGLFYPAFAGASVDEDRGFVQLTVNAAARFLATASPQCLKTSPDHRVVLAESSHDLGKLYQEAVDLLSVGACVITRSNHIGLRLHFRFSCALSTSRNVVLATTFSALLSPEVTSVYVRDEADESYERPQRGNIFSPGSGISDVCNKTTDPGRRCP